jgi:metallo-beta-lactamase family protein
MSYFSAHADYKEMLDYLSCQMKKKVKEIFLVHGDEAALGAWKSRLLQHGFDNVSIAKMEQTVQIGRTND